MYRICIFYLYDLSLVCCKALWSNKVEVEDDDERKLTKSDTITRNSQPRPQVFSTFKMASATNMLLKILGVLYHVKHNEMSSFHFNNGFGLPENKQCNLCNFAVTYQRRG